jgi:hypothetical protein
MFLMPEGTIAKPVKGRSLAGRQRVSSDKQNEKAKSSRFESFDPDSNIRFESILQPLKQDLETVSTDEGIQTD